jgi:hypothetical protein
MRAGLIIGAALIVAAVSDSPPSFAATDATKEISAQRRARIVITPERSGYPGRYAKRECESWLQVENRPSGQVLTPQMRCFWR